MKGENIAENFHAGDVHELHLWSAASKAEYPKNADELTDRETDGLYSTGH